MGALPNRIANRNTVDKTWNRFHILKILPLGW